MKSHLKKNQIGKIVVSPNINGYAIIESKSVRGMNNDIINYLSENIEIYQFEIDIWIPFMLFKYYKNKKLVRSCEYTLDLKGECISEKKWDKKLVCENDDIEIGQPEDGYESV
jgi:hypothetical protein